MRTLIGLVTVATLSGCVVAPPAQRVAYDPYQWHVVSVTPVQRAPGVAPQTETTSEPMPATTTTYVATPAPVYAPAPVYVAPYPYYAPAPAYYYPPVSIGLDFMFGWGRHWGGRVGYRHGR